MSCVLRHIFEDKMSKKYSSVNWKDEIKPKDVKCEDDEGKKLRDKNIEEWDTSLLAKMLLNSPHHLLVVNSSGCKCKNFESEFGWKEEYKVLIVAGKNTSKAEVQSINDKTFVYSRSKNKVEMKENDIIYLCSPEWNAVNKLCDIRNVLFAHVPSTAMKKEVFDGAVKDVESCYKTLQICKECESKLKEILSGMFTFLFIFNVVLS